MVRMDDFISIGVLKSQKDGLCKVAFDDEDVREEIPLCVPYGYKPEMKEGSEVLVFGLRGFCFVLGCFYGETETFLEMKEGQTHLYGKDIFHKKGTKSIGELQKELLEALSGLVGNTNAPNGPVVFSPNFIQKIESLKREWN